MPGPTEPRRRVERRARMERLPLVEPTAQTVPQSHAARKEHCRGRLRPPAVVLRIPLPLLVLDDLVIEPFRPPRRRQRSGQPRWTVSLDSPPQCLQQNVRGLPHSRTDQRERVEPNAQKQRSLAPRSARATPMRVSRPIKKSASLVNRFGQTGIASRIPVRQFEREPIPAGRRFPVQSQAERSIFPPDPSKDVSPSRPESTASAATI